jgi:hypothetical protein
MTNSNAILLKKTNDEFLETAETSSAGKSAYIAETLVGGVEVIEKLSAEWIALCEEGASNEPFFRPEWFKAFVQNFEKEILLITVRKSEKLCAVLPLVKKIGTLHGIPVRKLSAVFNLQSQRFDLIHTADESEKTEILKILWTEIKLQSKWDVFEIRLVMKTSWLNNLLEIAAVEGCKTGAWQMDSAPFIALRQGNDKEKLIDEYFKGLKKHFRQELKRRFRRLQELGKVEFVLSREFSPKLMRKYFELEMQSWKGREGTAAACDARTEKLHSDFARAVAAQNALYIYELKLNDKTIAMSINIKYDQGTVFWKTSFDKKYSRYSPGNLVIQEFLADCIKNGSSELDMLSPTTNYKTVWASGEREHFAFYIFQKGISGAFLNFWKFGIIKKVRKFKSEPSAVAGG